MDELLQTNTENEEETRQVSTNENDLEANANNANVSSENKQEVKKEESTPQKDPSFVLPVEGEMMKEYAKDRLVYSETLKEWVVHTGVDIKAEKTTVVKAAESGKVTAIKNDPRYGITVIIEHTNGYETRYANLLTAEFVNVGEEVEIRSNNWNSWKHSNV
ncbi:MAG: M23 family metallopeptidase [Clostridia bacterium]|nr:M23 family metallopeptidase [Clostridia bacterium]